MKTVFLGLGSNVGDREENFRQAEQRIEQARVRIVRCSSIYETEPMYETDQPLFLNKVVEGETEVLPRTLLRQLKLIEKAMGRKPGPANSPRLIDIDILLYGKFVIDAPELQVPHPRLIERRFALEPLLEIAPVLRHPVTGMSLMEVLKRLPPQGVRKFSV